MIRILAKTLSIIISVLGILIIIYFIALATQSSFDGCLNNSCIPSIFDQGNQFARDIFTAVSLFIAASTAIISFVSVSLSEHLAARIKGLSSNVQEIFGLHDFIEQVSTLYRHSNKRIISVQRVWHAHKNLEDALIKFSNGKGGGEAIFCGPVKAESLYGLFWRLSIVYLSNSISEKKFEFLCYGNREEDAKLKGAVFSVPIRFTIADNNVLLSSSVRKSQEFFAIPYKNDKQLADFYNAIFLDSIEDKFTYPIDEGIVNYIFREIGKGGELQLTRVLNIFAEPVEKIKCLREDPSEIDVDEYKKWVLDYLCYMSANQTGKYRTIITKPAEDSTSNPKKMGDGFVIKFEEIE